MVSGYVSEKVADKTLARNTSRVTTATLSRSPTQSTNVHEGLYSPRRFVPHRHKQCTPAIVSSMVQALPVQTGRLFVQHLHFTASETFFSTLKRYQSDRRCTRSFLGAFSSSNVASGVPRPAPRCSPPFRTNLVRDKPLEFLSSLPPERDYAPTTDRRESKPCPRTRISTRTPTARLGMFLGMKIHDEAF